MKDIFLALGGFGILVAALTWLLKSLIAHLLKKDIATYKTELKSQADSALKDLEASLKIHHIEHEIRFSKLHSTRAEIIAEIYEKLAIAYSRTSSYAAPYEFEGEPDRAEKLQLAMDSVIDLFKLFDRKRIYLSEELCSKLEEYINELRSPIIDLTTYQNIDSQDQRIISEKIQVMRSAWKKVEKDIPLLRKALEKEFRNILGV